MKTYVFAPREPLMLRDGRLAAAGVSMRTLGFPWPSSVAGLVRTRIGQDEDGAFVLSKEEARKLFEVSVAGPWLVELDAEGRVKEHFFPTPADCLWHQEPEALGRLVRRKLGPIPVSAGTSSDLPAGLEVVWPIDTAAPSTKAAPGPAFISWRAMSAWLTLAADKDVWEHDSGLDALPVERRMHVAIDPDTGAAVEGKLFGSEGLSFTVGEGADARCFGLALACEDTRLAERVGPAHLGGERRLGLLHAASRPAPVCIALPKEARRLRLVIVTPGIFKAGFRPSDEVFGGEARIVAAAVGRPQVISGWDYAVGGPKASRRMAPAGSVYWVELGQGVDARAFAQRWWMKSLCENEQDARDGFGLALLGVL